METLSAALRVATLRAGTERARRIGRVRFVALPFEEGSAERTDPVSAPEWMQRILRLFRRFPSRVDGRPGAARP